MDYFEIAKSITRDYIDAKGAMIDDAVWRAERMELLQSIIDKQAAMLKEYEQYVAMLKKELLRKPI
jgi:hypothetical protein